MGGSGVQRPLKFVKYLREYGWNPIVLCPEPGAYHTFDESLNKELLSLHVQVNRVEAKTPFHRAGQSSKRIDFIPDWLAKPLRWLSTFFWLPDNKKGWIQPAFEKGLEIIKSQKIDAIYATAAPYSNLIIAKLLKEASGLPVIMDLRDDWLDSHLIKYPTPLHRKKMANIEKDTLEQADLITVINQDTKEAIESRYPEFNNVIKVNQGFDPEDFQLNQNKTVTEKNDKCRFLYSGLFYGDRKPDIFLQAIHEIAQTDKSFKNSIELHFQGGLEADHKNLIKELELNDLVTDYGYVDHEQAVSNLESTDILWLIVGHRHKANQVTVGKMFEYFGSRKPILGLVPEGSSQDLLKQYGAGFFADPYDKDAIKNQILEIYRLWKNESLPIADEDFVLNYDRKEITKSLSELLNSL